MSRLASLLSKATLTLIVNIPENSVEMARAAEEGGADALCLSPSEDKDAIKEVVASVKIPVGISLGDSDVSEAEMKEYVKTGIDFFDIPGTAGMKRIQKGKSVGMVIAIGPDYSAHDLTGLAKRPVDAVDAAIIQKEDWGKELTVGDLQQYITISMSTTLPVLVSAQKSIRASEAAIIWDTGAKGIIIGEYVTGTTPASIKAVAAEFKLAMEAIRE